MKPLDVMTTKIIAFWELAAAFWKKHPFIFAGVGSAIVYAVFFIVAWSRLDPDFGWHLQTGNYILAHGVPHKDIYTYTARNHLWVDHEWGNDVVVSLLYKAGGYLLDALVFALIWTVGLLLIGCKSRSWVLLLAAVAIAPYAGVRPIAWSLLLFALTLRILKSKNKQWRWVLPLMFVLWANLHAGFIAGLALILYYAVIELDVKLTILLVATGLVTLINPYGTGLYGEIGRTLFDPYIHKQINEWRPLYVLTPTKPYIFLWGAGFILFAKPFWKRWINLGPLLLAAGLSASRNFPLFIVATVHDANSYVSMALHKIPRRLPFVNRLVLGVSILLSLLVIAYAVDAALFPIKNRLNGYPVAEVAYLKVHSCSGNIFNDYDYGGYLIWQLPSKPVYIDGRMATWEKHMNTYLSIVNHPLKNYPSQFKKYSIQCALLSRSDSKLINALKSHGWRTVVKTSNSSLLEPRTQL